MRSTELYRIVSGRSVVFAKDLGGFKLMGGFAGTRFVLFCSIFVSSRFPYVHISHIFTYGVGEI